MSLVVFSFTGSPFALVVATRVYIRLAPLLGVSDRLSLYASVAPKSVGAYLYLNTAILTVAGHAVTETQPADSVLRAVA